MEKENWTVPHNIRYSARREHFAPPLFLSMSLVQQRVHSRTLIFAECAIISRVTFSI